MELLISESAKRAVKSLWDDRIARLPTFQAGSAEALSVGVLDEIRSPFDARLFTPQDLTAVIFKAALGVGFLIPVDGSFPLTFTAADLSTQTTADISYDPSSFEIADALNALSKVQAIGGISVEGGDGFFRFTFNTVGARQLLSGDAGSLVPLSVLDVQHVVIGDSDTREVQTIRIVQSAAAFATLAASSSAAGATLTTVQAGGGGKNHQMRVTLTGNIYIGTWLFSKGNGQSGPIGYDDTAPQIEAALEAAITIGEGNVRVVQENNGQYLITFIGGLANTDLTAAPLAVDGMNLVAIQEKSGVLDLSTPGIGMLLNGSEERVVVLEIEKLVGNNPPEKILRRDVLLRRPVIEPAMTSAPPIPEIFVSAVTLSGITSMSGGGALTDLSSIDIRNLAAGSGPYFIRLGATGEFVAVYVDAGAADPDDPAECASIFTAGKHWTRGI